MSRDPEQWREEFAHLTDAELAAIVERMSEAEVTLYLAYLDSLSKPPKTPASGPGPGSDNDAG